MEKEAERAFKVFIDAEKANEPLKHYLYPLTGANYTDFGSWGNIKEVLVDKPGKLIYINTSVFRSSHGCESLPSYMYDIHINGKRFRVFRVEDKYATDIQLLLQGRYTELHPDTKTHICKSAALRFNKKKNTFYDSSSYLQALYVDSPLRTFIAEYYEIKIAEIPVEVISKISDTSPLYIENYIKGGA